MPIYRYKCEEHGEYDRFVTVEDRDDYTCDYCGKPISRVITAPRGIHGANTGDRSGT